MPARRRSLFPVCLGILALSLGGCLNGGYARVGYGVGYGGGYGCGYGGYGGGHVTVCGTDAVAGAVLFAVAGGVAIFEAIFGCH